MQKEIIGMLHEGGYTNMIIARGLGKNIAGPRKVRALFLLNPKAIIMFI